VVGHQWWWEFQYTDLGISTANELHLVVNQTASFQLNSADVIHSFWFPLMGGKMDVFPARDNHMWFTPQKTGDFHGQCVEFCGTQHANMRMRLVVESQSDFQAWAQRQRTDAIQPTSAQARQGSEIFQKSVCIACHTIRGTAAKGTIGPDLTHVGSRKTIAAGVLDNTPDKMTQWIRDPQSIKEGSKMTYGSDTAKVPLSDADLASVVAYLQELK